MYIPASFVERDPSRILAIMRESPLATVIAGGPEPQVGQAPTLVSEHGGIVSIEFHLAVNNPLCELLPDGSSCLILHTGPNCYVSPSWYARHPSVPTWNYVSVEARGLVRRLNSEELADQVTELSRIHEQRVGGSWEYDGLPVEFQQKMLQGICGFRVTATQLEA
ncbi:MAG: FMN-binding negative transcriptional regulator, partial [Planctomycetaceae bacterium]|nr:FMN-binding negative transcriptional regulator [Planctomycetaceae bacterium]